MNIIATNYYRSAAATRRGEHATGEHAGSPLRGCPQPTGENIGSSPVGDVVQWFKTMTTNHYIRGVKQNGWQSFDGKPWQRNYYEHIIRTPWSYEHIVDYIENNPKKWDMDTLK